MKNPFLAGNQVYLRSLDRADAPLLVPWLNDPEVTRHLVRLRPLNLREEEEFIDKANQDENDLTLAIVLCGDDRLIGGAGFHKIDWVNRQASFGIFLGDKKEWGKGYGKEATRLVLGHAFDTLNLNRVWLRVYEYNTRALLLYEKLGFHREGALRQDRYYEGRYWDTVVMGLLREEWIQLRKSPPVRAP